MPTNNHSDNLFDSQAPLDDEQLWDLLSLYVDGEADPAQAAIVEQMLSSDPAYRRDFDFLMESSKTMQMVAEVAPPIGLRDAVYARTTRRPTLADRLRAVWSRAAAPAFGRYATVGGAFAVALLGVALFRPHLASNSNPGTSQPIAAVDTIPVNPEVVTNTPLPRLPDFDFTMIEARLHLTPNATSVQEQAVNTPPVKPLSVPNHSKVVGTNETKLVSTTPGPRNHPLTKVNVARTESVPNPALRGYPYDPKMDDKAAPGHMETIASVPNDFGPKIAPSEEPSAPSNGGAYAAVTKTPDADGTIKPAPEAPKTHIRIAALPPRDKQVLSEMALRRNQNTQYGGYDHTVADNIQNHELVYTLAKGTF